MTDPTSSPNVPTSPIEVPASPAGTQTATVGRDALLVVATLPALVAVLGTHDVKQIVDWLASQQGVAFLGLLVAVATPVWRQFLARRKHANDVVMVSNIKNKKVAVIKK